MKVPEGWEVKKLGEIADLNPRESLHKGKVYPYIDMASVSENNRLPKRVLYKEYKGSGSKFRKGDVLFARITPCLENGKTAFVKDFPQDEVGFGSTEFIVIRQKKGVSNGLFLYYLSRWNTFREIAKKKMFGTSGRQRVSAQALESIDVPYPPLPEQQKIAEILGSIDDQIENLMEQNKTLEEIAKTIFKRWFIDFEFPNEEGKPYKSSGGEFVGSELGKIPKGWRVGKLKEIVEIKNGFAFKSKDYQEKGVLLIRTKNFDGKGFLEKKDVKYLPSDFYNTYSKYRLQRFDLLLVMVGASIGKTAIVTSNVLPALQNQNMWNIKAKDDNLKFVAIELVKEIIKRNNHVTAGSARDFFRKDYFSNIKIVIPEENVAKKLNIILMSIYEQIDLNVSKIETLKTIRDTLLPKLITGEIRVKV